MPYGQFERANGVLCCRVVVLTRLLVPGQHCAATMLQLLLLYYYYCCCLYIHRAIIVHPARQTCLIARHALLVQTPMLGQRFVECIDGRCVGEVGRSAWRPCLPRMAEYA